MLVLLLGALLIGIAERHGSGSLEHVIGRELAREARHSAERLSSVLRTEQQTLASFARQDLMREIRVADIDKRIAQALATLRDGSPLRIGYWVVDRSGQVVAASDPRRIGPAPAWATETLSTTNEQTARLARRRLLLTAPVPDPDDAQRMLGVLVGVLDWSRVTALTAEVRSELAARGLASDLFLCDPSGTVVGGAWADAPSEAMRAMLRRAVAEVRSTPDGPPMAQGEPPGLRGGPLEPQGDWIVGRARLASDLPAPLSEHHLLVVESRRAALAPARALSKRLLATMGLVLLLALGAAALGARRVVRPLAELTGAIRGLAQGDAGARQVPVRSDDEIGTLAQAFNQMAGDLDRAQRDLVEAEKFAFVGELAAGVAHEIRTSLGVLRSSAQLLEQSLPEDSDGQTSELAHMIGAEVDRLGGVVNDLLTLDRPNPPRLESVKLSQPVGQAVGFVLPRAAEKRVEISQEGPVVEPRVRCEPELVYRVAVNLLVNAMEAVEKGGRIRVRVLGAEGGFGGFRVSDDGRGIPEDLRDRVFQPFVTGRAGGVGLGLTFVKRVVHDHRGRVSVESSPGQGTSFQVQLPLDREAEESA